ncbi:MAG: glycosyltransferase, partial [Nitrososphaerales archaeon]
MSIEYPLAASTREPSKENESGSYPFVSIVLPVFNDQDTLKDCLDSLRKQSYSNFEIIVVNDASSDRSPEIVQEMSRQDSRLRLLDIPHSGTSTAKNSGFQESKGSIIFFAEGDAIYDDSYLSKAVECICYDSSIVGVCVLGGVWETRRTFVTRSIDTENQIRDTQLITGRRSPYFAWVFTREALEKAGLYDAHLKQAEDRELFGRVRKSG